VTLQDLPKADKVHRRYCKELSMYNGK